MKTPQLGNWRKTRGKPEYTRRATLGGYTFVATVTGPATWLDGISSTVRVVMYRPTNARSGGSALLHEDMLFTCWPTLTGAKRRATRFLTTLRLTPAARAQGRGRAV